ncbi:MAG TPA: 7TM diverse intracellular signaling domain-containing protein [Oligoflexus sp.]|uniref:7TM diverse intracellular signaling domain-containing protein n=1 Tax=Oligoflexus sp. TaxID=1971216 RepID=UPI002D7FBBBB|nr:7TM diverse intracellular signaling domain-containing protein [Oligoflexus sp.]HET9237852.1 7TM diverse intracellular signaling domain-containing protein [Oligoflexus sp.]
MSFIKAAEQSGSIPKLLRLLGLLLVFSLPLMNSPAFAGQHVTAKAGELDASAWDPDQIYTLYGEWYFVGNELLAPDDFLRRQREGDRLPTTRIGLSMQQSAPDRLKSERGYGTYILRLKNLPPAQIFAIAETAAYVSARIYVFDSEGRGGQAPVENLGHVAEDAAQSKSELSQRQVIPFLTAAQGDTYLMIQVANHVHAWGGLWYPPTIGYAAPVMNSVNSALKSNSVAFGVMLFIGFYNLMFFFYRPKDKGSLYLTFIAATLLARTWIFNHYGLDYFGDGYWGLQLSFKIIYITLFTLPWAAFCSVRGFFPKLAASWMTQLVSKVSLIGILFVLLTPSHIFGAVGNVLFITGILLGFFSGYLALRAVLAGEPDARIVLFGISAIVIASLFELLNALNFIQFGRNGMTFGMAIFAACQSQIISKQFAQALNRSEHLSAELHTEVQRQTRDIRSLLDNLNQGIFTLTAGSQKIGSLFSASLRTIIGRDHIEGATIKELLLDRSDLKPDHKARMESALAASLGEDRIAFELNASNLVQEFSYSNEATGKTQQLELDWAPIHDQADRVEQILISVRDVSEIRELKKQARQRQEDIEILQELVDVAEDRFIRFLQKAQDFLNDNQRIIAEPYKSEALQSLFINMHTLKGIARSYHFTHLAHVVHLAEETLSEIRQGRQDWDPLKLEDDRRNVASVCEHYGKIAREKLGWTTSGATLRLKKQQIEGMISYIQKAALSLSRDESRLQLAALEKTLLEIRYHPLPLVLDEASRGLDSLARSIGKLPPTLHVTADDVILLEGSAATLHGVFTHLLRNSLDHGLEEPAQREAAGKARHGIIRIETRVTDDELHIFYEDDGRGLDLLDLERRAADSSVLNNDEARAQLMFVPGLSTKNQSTELSGRGVGMDAVRSLLQSLGGDIRIELLGAAAHGRRNFRLILRIPAQCLVQPALLVPEDIRLRNSSGF